MTTASRAPVAAAVPAAVPGPASGPAEGEDLYEHAPCGYLLVRDDGTIVRVNSTFLAWTGHRRHDLLGTRVEQLLPVGDRILYLTHCLPALQMTGSVAEFAVDVLDAAGARRSCLLTATRDPGGAGVPPLVRLIVFSAHARRRYERELLAALRQAEEAEAHRQRAEAALHHLVLHDGLTGLLNRDGLLGQARTALQEPAAGATPGVLFVDLDHFKAVNDSLGHAAGDLLLREVARRLRSAVRSAATVARLSGDEFIVLDRFDGEREAAALAQRLLDLLGAPVVIDGLEVVTGASIGVALTGRGDRGGGAEAADRAAEHLLRSADLAMYQAKARGRGGWELHDPAHRDPEVHRLQLVGQLRAAIAHGQMRVHYQPRLVLGTGEVHGAEALVRWQHPERGLLPPSEFIDVAEQTGLIRDLGWQVLHLAVAQAVRWGFDRPGRPPRVMAVNLSIRQLADPELVDRVRDALARHGLAARCLVLEITETALMADADGALTTLTALRELGVGLSIDDFGTGYSSFTYLKRFPADELKIDRSFVAGLGSDLADTAIVSSCVRLAHAVGVRAVAEGVETPAQREALVELGCDLGQGHLLGRPAPAEHLPRMAPGPQRAAPRR